MGCLCSQRGQERLDKIVVAAGGGAGGGGGGGAGAGLQLFLVLLLLACLFQCVMGWVGGILFSAMVHTERLQPLAVLGSSKQAMFWKRIQIGA